MHAEERKRKCLEIQNCRDIKHDYQYVRKSESSHHQEEQKKPPPGGRWRRNWRSSLLIIRRVVGVEPTNAPLASVGSSQVGQTHQARRRDPCLAGDKKGRE